MIITLSTQKGGAGKSALAMHLGTALHARYDVLIADGDPQATTESWHARGVAKGRDIPPTVGMGDGMHHALRKLRPKHEYILVDTAGKHVPELGRTFGVTDLVLLPTEPETGSVEALMGTLRRLEDSKAERPDMLALVLVTQYRRTNLADALIGALRQESPVPVLDTVLTYSNEYRVAHAEGRGVTQRGSAEKPRAEIGALIRELKPWFRKAARYGA